MQDGTENENFYEGVAELKVVKAKEEEKSLTMTTSNRGFNYYSTLSHPDFFYFQRGLEPNFPLFTREENCIDEFT